MAVVLRLSATVQSGQPILVQSWPTALHNIYSPGDQSGNHCYSSGVVQKLRGLGEVGRWSKNTFYVHVQGEKCLIRGGKVVKKDRHYVHIVIE